MNRTALGRENAEKRVERCRTHRAEESKAERNVWYGRNARAWCSEARANERYPRLKRNEERAGGIGSSEDQREASQCGEREPFILARLGGPRLVHLG